MIDRRTSFDRGKALLRYEDIEKKKTTPTNYIHPEIFLSINYLGPTIYRLPLFENLSPDYPK